MTPGQFFVIAANHPAMAGSGQVRPYAQVLREPGRYTVQLSGNRWLGPDFQLRADQEAALSGVGVGTGSGELDGARAPRR